MPRPRRICVADIPQHVVQRGHDRQRTFIDVEDRRRYLHWLSEAAARFSCDIHAYVLMTNHVHLLVTPRVPGAIAAMTHSLGTNYVRYFNDRRGRSGTLWEGRHKACLVETESYFLMCQRYIELNPVRAGIVTDPARYKWSSYRRNALVRRDPLVTEHSIYSSLGRDAETRALSYRELFATELSGQQLQQIRNDLNKSTPQPQPINDLARSV